MHSLSVLQYNVKIWHKIVTTIYQSYAETIDLRKQFCIQLTLTILLKYIILFFLAFGQADIIERFVDVVDY